MDRQELAEKKHYSFKDLQDIVKILRSDDGCPWDKVQTHDSIRGCMIEECYETVNAINHSDMNNLKEELGDVLFQVVMHGEMAREENEFEMQDILDGICRKMIFRHPHVFANDSVENVNWEELKKQEKKGTEEAELLRAIPDSFPALIRAQKVLKKSERLYGDVNNAEESLEIIREKLDEIDNSIKNDKIGQNIGSCLLEMANLSRIFQQNAEISLTNTIEQFINKREGNDVKKE